MPFRLGPIEIAIIGCICLTLVVLLVVWGIVAAVALSRKKTSSG